MKRNKIILTIDLFFAIVLLLTFAFQDNIKNYMIQKRFQNNEYESSNDYQKITFNNSLIIDTNEEKVYDNKYEAEIQNRGENNDYKIIDLTVANNKGWLVVVYDPSNVHIMKSRAFKTPNNDGKENIIDMTKRYGATIGVNGGGFYDDGKVSKDIPFGYIIEN